LRWRGLRGGGLKPGEASTLKECYFLSEALSGYNIGLKPIGVGKFKLFWGQLLVALFQPASADPIRLARRKKKLSRRTQPLATGHSGGKKMLGFVEPRL
jgi:hypothetical protein